MKKILYSTLTLALLFLTACGSTPASSSGGLKILASTSFLADIAQNIAGNRVHIESILPFGADPHAYQPAPSDAAEIAKSNLLILNGLEYEGFINSLLQNAGGDRLIVFASDGLNQLTMQENGIAVGDPHMWLDPVRVVKYVENIRDGLIQVDPEGSEIYMANANAYITQLNELDAWIVEQVSVIPVEQRLLVTNHESLGYFSERYNFTVIGAVFPSLSSEAGTSAREMTGLIEQIKASGVRAIFISQMDNPDLANQIAEETKIKVINDLYLESLSDGPPAATYIDMMKYNVTRIVEQLSISN